MKATGVNKVSYDVFMYGTREPRTDQSIQTRYALNQSFLLPTVVGYRLAKKQEERLLKYCSLCSVVVVVGKCSNSGLQCGDAEVLPA